MRHMFANHDLQTSAGGQLIDVTEDVVAVVESSEVQNGIAVVYSPHTTCSVLINERESGFTHDLNEMFNAIAPKDGHAYRHDDLTVRTEGLDGDPHEIPNGHAHCRASLMSASQTIPIVDGRLRLGRWQRVFFCELDRSRDRKVYIQVMGE